MLLDSTRFSRSTILSRRESLVSESWTWKEGRFRRISRDGSNILLQRRYAMAVFAYENNILLYYFSVCDQAGIRISYLASEREAVR